MMFKLEFHGDSLERAYADFICQRFPVYEEIWKIYIGNNSKAKIIALDHLEPNLSANRVQFSEYNYSCLESIILLKRIVDRYLVERVLNNIEEYLDSQNDFLLFQLHLGRIKDLVEKMGVIINKKGIEKELNEYYQQRNTVIHGKKLPFIFIEGVLGIPIPKGQDEDIGKWSSDKNWDDVDANSFELISEFYKVTFDNLLICLNKVYFNILTSIKSIVQVNNIEIQPVDVSYNNSCLYENTKLTYQNLIISGSKNI
jgi:hypothetical protein